MQTQTLRSRLAARMAAELILRLDDIVPGEVLFMRRLSVAELDAARGAAKSCDSDGVVTIDFERAQENILAAALLGSDDPSDRLYGLGEGAALRAHLLPGEFERLAVLQSALLGYQNSESARLGFYATGPRSPSGASTGSDGTPPNSDSTVARSSTPGATTAN